MDINQKEQALIRELMEKYPVVVQESPASPEHLYADNLELYAKMYIEQHPEMDRETASREILSYAEKAKQNDISVLPPKGNLQKDGLYFSHGELVLPGFAAMKDHHLVSYSEGVQKAYDSIRHTEPLITRDVLRIVDRAGAECAGLSFAVKTGSSLSGKLALENPSIEDISANSVYKLKDIVRYTVLASNKDFTDVAKHVMSSFSKAGYELFQVKNRFIDPIQTTGYRGLHLNFVSPYGVKIEVQCHTPDTFRTKMMVHDLYKETQNPCLSDTRRDGYFRLMRSYYEQTRPVPHVEEIPSCKHQILEIVQPSVHLERNADRSSEYFSVSKNGQILLSGYECHGEKGNISVGYSFSSSECTHLYQVHGGHLSARTYKDFTDFAHDGIPEQQGTPFHGQQSFSFENTER